MIVEPRDIDPPAGPGAADWQVLILELRHVGMSDSDIARIVRCQRGAVSKVRRGLTRVPSRATRAVLAALGRAVLPGDALMRARMINSYSEI